MSDVIRVGLLGCGNVGSAVARMLHEHTGQIQARSGARVDVARVAVRHLGRGREVPIPREAFTTDAGAVVADPGIDVIVELMGGVEPARSLILQAFASGKSVVTANKELLATGAGELFEAAARNNVDLLYEASVGGGIPLIRPLRESLAGDRICRFMGIVNGTTNHILTRMAEDGLTMPEALAEAQQQGLAEADPTADVEGHDAAAKAAILATIAFDLPIVAGDVYREGISGITQQDIGYAHGLGYEIKLLAIGEADGDSVAVRVHPAMIPAEHPLASVRESFNAVYLEGEKVGPLMLYGRGAGGDPTATSVVGDLIELARNRAAGSLPSVIHHTPRAVGVRRLRPIEDLTAQYYILMEVADRHGVLASIATVFAMNEVSIKQVWQEGHGDEAQLVMITHRASERSLRACVEALSGIDPVKSVRSVLRVEASEP